MVENLIVKDGKVSGVAIKDRAGELFADVVIAADGVLSFMARRFGLWRNFGPANLGLGVKLLMGLPEAAINERFHLVRDQGADISFLGSTGGIHGGGFLYTNHETLSIGTVLHLNSLSASGKTPYEVLDEMLRHPQVKKLIKGAVPLEYSAHLVPEGGIKAVPQLYADGIMIAGDAAGLCYTNGINLEGINLAMTSGALAAETAIGAAKAKDFSAAALSSYKTKLSESFIMQDMKTFKNAAGMLHLDRLYQTYPQIVTDIFTRIYKVDGEPRRKLLNLALKQALRKVKLSELTSDGFKIGKAL